MAELKLEGYTNDRARGHVELRCDLLERKLQRARAILKNEPQ
jgi:hypothetical protein